MTGLLTTESQPLAPFERLIRGILDRKVRARRKDGCMPTVVASCMVGGWCVSLPFLKEKTKGKGWSTSYYTNEGKREA